MVRIMIEDDYFCGIAIDQYGEESVSTSPDYWDAVEFDSEADAYDCMDEYGFDGTVEPVEDEEEIEEEYEEERMYA